MTRSRPLSGRAETQTQAAQFQSLRSHPVRRCVPRVPIRPVRPRLAWRGPACFPVASCGSAGLASAEAGGQVPPESPEGLCLCAPLPPDPALPRPRPQPRARHPREVWVGGVHKARWQAACWVGGGRRGPRAAGSRGPAPSVPSSPSSHLPRGTTKWPSAEGPRGCWWGNTGLYCEARAQMDPRTVCCLPPTDGVWGAGGGAGGGAEREAMASVLWAPGPPSLEGAAEGHLSWEGPATQRLGLV